MRYCDAGLLLDAGGSAELRTRGEPARCFGELAEREDAVRQLIAGRRFAPPDEPTTGAPHTATTRGKRVLRVQLKLKLT